MYNNICRVAIACLLPMNISLRASDQILEGQPLVSDCGMHHVPWCMSGSPNPWWRGKRSRHSRHMHNPLFYVPDKRPIVVLYCDQLVWCGKPLASYLATALQNHMILCTLHFRVIWPVLKESGLTQSYCQRQTWKMGVKSTFFTSVNPLSIPVTYIQTDIHIYIVFLRRIHIYIC